MSRGRDSAADADEGPRVHKKSVSGGIERKPEKGAPSHRRSLFCLWRRGVCSGVTHRLGRGEARMGFDPSDGQVVVPADSGEKAPDSLNEGLVAARFDGVVPE